MTCLIVSKYKEAFGVEQSSISNLNGSFEIPHKISYTMKDVYLQASNVSRTLIGNIIVEYSAQPGMGGWVFVFNSPQMK